MDRLQHSKERSWISCVRERERESAIDGVWQRQEAVHCDSGYYRASGLPWRVGECVSHVPGPGLRPNLAWRARSRASSCAARWEGDEPCWDIETGIGNDFQPAVQALPGEQAFVSGPLCAAAPPTKPSRLVRFRPKTCRLAAFAECRRLQRQHAGKASHGNAPRRAPNRRPTQAPAPRSSSGGVRSPCSARGPNLFKNFGPNSLGPSYIKTYARPIIAPEGQDTRRRSTVRCSLGTAG